MAEHLTYLYGCPDADIDAIASLLNSKLSLSLEARESSYVGSYYCDRSKRFAEFALYTNVDPLYRSSIDPPEDYWFEPDDRDCATLLFVDATEDVVLGFDESFSPSFPTFTLLKTSRYDDE